MPFSRGELNVDVRPDHICSTKKESKILCIDGNGMFTIYFRTHKFIKSIIGMEHIIQFVYCSCEALAITLARAELWPATPVNPRYAFAFDLLNWAEALLLEAHVSLKDFCKSLRLRCPIQIIKVSVSMC